MQRDIRFNELIYLIQLSKINARFIATSAHGSCLKRPPFGLLVIATPGSMYQLRFDDMAWLETQIGSLFFRFRMVIRELTVGVLLWTYDKVLPAFMFQVPSILLELIYCGFDACISILNLTRIVQFSNPHADNVSIFEGLNLYNEHVSYTKLYANDFACRTSIMRAWEGCCLSSSMSSSNEI